jgi:hypothetical protein
MNSSTMYTPNKQYIEYTNKFGITICEMKFVSKAAQKNSNIEHKSFEYFKIKYESIKML